MDTDERRKQLLNLIMQSERVKVSTLIEESGFSPATVRRDLTFFEKNGYISRVHGYAMYNKPDIVQTVDFSQEMIRIARAAAELVHDGDSIILDSGMTPLALAYQLVNKRNLTVITNSVPVAQLYSTVAEIQTFVAGGFLKVREAALVGEDTVDYFKKIRADKLFLSTTGVRAGVGLTCVTPFQADVKNAMIESAGEVILVAEAKKFERDAMRVFAPLERVNTIVTSAEPSVPKFRETLEKFGIRLIIAE